MDPESYILAKSAWLYTKIFENAFIYVDLWSFLYLWTGFMACLLVSASRLRRPLVILALIVIVFEIIEYSLSHTGLKIFMPETAPDRATDILLGISGGILSILFLRMLNRFIPRFPHLTQFMTMFIVSTSCAFLWVGFYHYHYNVETYNTPGINISTFTAWTTGGIFILLIYRLFRKINLMIRLALTWTLFFAGLLIFEYVYYYVLEVRETTGHPLKPLIFGLIHGTRTLHFFYLAAPFIFIALYEAVFRLIGRSISQPGWQRLR